MYVKKQSVRSKEMKNRGRSVNYTSNVKQEAREERRERKRERERSSQA
jgi:hypothetical protein